MRQRGGQREFRAALKVPALIRCPCCLPLTLPALLSAPRSPDPLQWTWRGQWWVTSCPLPGPPPPALPTRWHRPRWPKHCRRVRSLLRLIAHGLASFWTALEIALLCVVCPLPFPSTAACCPACRPDRPPHALHGLLAKHLAAGGARGQPADRHQDWRQAAGARLCLFD